MASYATIPEFEDYAGPGWVTDDEIALEHVLLRAARDIDSVLGQWTTDAVTGLKWSPADLTVYEAAVLRDATCAQAEYRILRGATFFLEGRSGTIVGPDFTIEGADQPYIGPQVWIELARAPRLRRPIGQGQAVI